MKTIATLAVGDTLISDRHKNRYRVMHEFAPGLFLLSERNNERCAGKIFTASQMETNRWKVEDNSEKPNFKVGDRVRLEGTVAEELSSGIGVRFDGLGESEWNLVQDRIMSHAVKID